MAVDLSDLLEKFARYLVARAATLGVTIAIDATPRGIWVHNAEEQGPTGQAWAADVYSVVRLYAGSVAWTPVLSCSVQVETLAPKGQDKAGLTRAQTLFNALTDASGRPARMATIAAPGASQGGWRANAIDPRLPAMVRRDDSGRGVWVMNVDLRVVALPATG